MPDWSYVNMKRNTTEGEVIKEERGGHNLRFMAYGPSFPFLERVSRRRVWPTASVGLSLLDMKFEDQSERPEK